MKKTLLASAILASLVSVSAQAATIYDQEGTTVAVSGSAEVVAYFDSETDYDGNSAGDDVDAAFKGTAASGTSGSLAIEGTTKISDDVTAYASFGVAADFGATAEDDDILVGFDTSFGDFSFGATDSAVGFITDFTDVGNEFGGNLETVEGSGKTGFAYSNTFSGVSVNAEFKASENKDEDSMGVSAIYSLDGLSVGLGFVTVDEDNELVFGLGYSVDALYVGLGYAMGTDADVGGDTDFTALELAVTYGVTDELTVMAFYGKGESEFGTTTYDSLDYYAVEATYTIASNLSASLGYSVNNLDIYSEEVVTADESKDSDTTIYTSISYDF